LFIARADPDDCGATAGDLAQKRCGVVMTQANEEESMCLGYDKIGCEGGPMLLVSMIQAARASE